MNMKRVAALLRELADEIDPTRAAVPAEKPRKRARVRVHPAPLHGPREIDVQRARAMLRRRGMAE